MSDSSKRHGGEQDHKSPDALLLKDAIDYSWKWFSYHAAQRMQTFNFFLVLVGALSVGYYQSFSASIYWYSAAVAFVGVWVSLALFIVEVRNEDLVQLGRDALKSIEERPEFHSLPREVRILTEDRERVLLVSHKFWLRFVELLVLSLFFMGWCASLVAQSRGS